MILAFCFVYILAALFMAFVVIAIFQDDNRHELSRFKFITFILLWPLVVLGYIRWISVQIIRNFTKGKPQ